MGVWIEITAAVGAIYTFSVTPCMGVWIEISKLSLKTWGIAVTPCMGVWIEITTCACSNVLLLSLPVWECGLKSEYVGTMVIASRHSLYGSVD